MIIGSCTIDLMFYEPMSLKDKRQILRSLMDRIKKRFNVSIAEVDFHDQWRSSRLGIACVSNEKAHANSMITSIINFIEKDGRVVVAGYHVELL